MNTTEYLLIKWGNYTRVHRTEYIGYSKINTIHRMMKQGIGASQSTNSDYDMPEDIVDIDRAVNQLPPKLQKALYLKYVFKQPIRKAAFDMGEKKNQYVLLVVAAEARVAGFREGIYCA